MLDLCTGGGSLAILAAGAFPDAKIDAVDFSRDALDVARRNIEEHGLADRIELVRGRPVQAARRTAYDLILTNPPYVDAESLAAFPPEFAAEPRMAHAGGKDGLDIVRRILAERARASERRRRADLRDRPGPRPARRGLSRSRLVWLDTRESEGEVFFIRAEDLPRRAWAEAPRRRGTYSRRG